MAEVNEQRAERQNFKKGGSKGDQGGYGSGSVKQSSCPASKPKASFKEASAVIGEEIVGDLSIPGIAIAKGASAPSGVTLNKGSKSVGGGSGKARKPKAAEEAGH